MTTYIGLDQIDWSGAGPIWKFWRADCCGGEYPCISNPIQSIKCVATYWLCGACANAKIYSESTTGSCNVVPQCLFSLFCPTIATVLWRYNVRQGQSPGHIVGDCICLHCNPCAACAYCQQLRAAKNMWELWPIPGINIMGPMKLMK